MLRFKNAQGEIVMTENDNGKLEIHDEKLRESFAQKSVKPEEEQSEEEKKDDCSRN